MKSIRTSITLMVIVLTCFSTVGLMARSTQAQGFKPLPEPVEGKIDESAIKQIDLKAIPILPDFTAYADQIKLIYVEGQRQGRKADVFTKFGDCMTSNPAFLTPFASGDYALGNYESLKAVIAYFSKASVRADDPKLNSFSNPSLSAASGFNVANVLDATWSDPKLCGVEESPMACELRVVNPAYAIILFGTNDLKSLTTDQFDFYLRKVIVDTYNAGVIPLISTFPNQPGLLEKSLLYNQVIANATQEYNLPLINLWLAFDPLPNQGIDPKEPTHMTTPASGKVASFAAADLTAGHNVHNLLTLRALEAVLNIVHPK